MEAIVHFLGSLGHILIPPWGSPHLPCFLPASCFRGFFCLVLYGSGLHDWMFLWFLLDTWLSVKAGHYLLVLAVPSQPSDLISAYIYRRQKVLKTLPPPSHSPSHHPRTHNFLREFCMIFFESRWHFKFHENTVQGRKQSAQFGHVQAREKLLPPKDGAMPPDNGMLWCCLLEGSWSFANLRDVYSKK